MSKVLNINYDTSVKIETALENQRETRYDTLTKIEIDKTANYIEPYGIKNIGPKKLNNKDVFIFSEPIDCWVGYILDNIVYMVSDYPKKDDNIYTVNKFYTIEVYEMYKLDEFRNDFDYLN